MLGVCYITVLSFRKACESLLQEKLEDSGCGVALFIKSLLFQGIVKLKVTSFQLYYTAYKKSSIFSTFKYIWWSVFLFYPLYCNNSDRKL